MSRVIVYPVRIEFGDCDPAGIVFFPNFSRWMDAASLNFFAQCGVLPWRELAKSTGIIGTPLLEIHTRFLKHATYGESLLIHTSVEEWRERAFVQKHVVMRGEELICEGLETRMFVRQDPLRGGRLRGIAVPPDIRALCE